MRHQAPLAVLFYVSLFTFASAAQAQLTATSSPDSNSLPSLRGTIVNIHGKPASGIHIEVDDAGTAVPITSTYTRADGSFELYNIPAGSYELIAETDGSQATDSITVQPGAASLSLRLQPSAAPVSPLPATISVAQMMVPQRAQKLFHKAQAAFNEGKTDKSLSLTQEALQIEPEYPDALTLRGLIEMNSGKLDDAERDFERALQIDPNAACAYVGLSTVYNHEGRFDDAMRFSQHSLSLSPRSWQAYFEMAKAAIGEGMYARGLQLAREAQRLSGDSFAAVHLIKAYALVPMRFYKAAHYELQAFLSHKPADSSARQAQMLLAEVDAALPASGPVH